MPSFGIQRGPSLYPVRACASLGKPPLPPARSLPRACSLSPSSDPNLNPLLPTLTISTGTSAPGAVPTGAGPTGAGVQAAGGGQGTGLGLGSSAAALARLQRLSGNGSPGTLSKSDSAHDSEGRTRLVSLQPNLASAAEEQGSGKG